MTSKVKQWKYWISPSCSVHVCFLWVWWEVKVSLCSKPPIFFWFSVKIQDGKVQSRRCFHCLVHSALPAVPRDSTGLKDSVTLTLSPSMSLASTKAIWGAAESLSNKITLSICTLHGSDCRVLRLPIPRHWTYFSSFSSTLLILAYMTNSNWKPHTPKVGAQSTVRLKKRPPAHQTKLYSLKARIERMKRSWARGKQMKGKTSHHSPSVILADKRTNCVSASWHQASKLI